MAWDNLSGGDHDGNEWIISSDIDVAGTHTNIGTFRIESGITVSIEAYDGANYGSFSVEAETIDIVGDLNADATGYRHSEGPGAGEDGELGGDGGLACRQGGGGSYGGHGGVSAQTETAAGPIYGSISTVNQMGSGGGDAGGTSTRIGGTGGGSIILTATTTVSLSGNITANGGAGLGDAYYNAAGGGSGGSVYITTSSISGSGTISANGGNGGDSTDGWGKTGCGDGGGGGGGRIYISYASGTYELSVTTHSGVGPDGAKDGAPGTVMINNSDSSTSQVILSDRVEANSETASIINTSSEIDKLIIDEKGYLILDSDTYLTISSEIETRDNSRIDISDTSNCDFSETTLIPATGTTYINGSVEVKNITVGSGATITHNPNTEDLTTYTLELIVSNDLTIESGGSINLNYKGHPGGPYTLDGYGPGKGLVGGEWAWGGGGAYGGNGGEGADSSWGVGGAGGTSYGSETEPSHLGSGGGGSMGTAGKGGNGGGLLKLTVNGTLLNNGSISANGEMAQEDKQGGGGSGGSIYITTNTLSGEGEISANGGLATGGGGGSGGRIAIYSGVNTLSGDITVTKGSGYNNGEDGTIYTEVLDVTAPTGNLAINNGDSYTTTESITLTISATDDISGVDQMIISNSTDFSQSSWISYSTSTSWTLTSEEGDKTVYIKFKDVDGNESETINDSIILDSIAPTASNFGSVGGNVSDSREITLNTSASDSYSDLYQMRTALGSDCSSASWETYATTKNITLPNIEGFNIVCAQFKDNAGNLSSTYEATIRLDLYKPATFTKIVPENEASIDTNYPSLKWNKSSDSGVGLSKYTIYVDGVVYFDNITPELSTMIPAQLFSTYADPDKVIVYAPDFIELTPRTEEYQIDEGSHQWYIIATDGVGRTTQTSTWLFNIDTSEPTNDFIKPEVIIEEEPEEGIEDIAEPIIDEEGNTEFEAEDSLPRFVGETEPESDVEITLNPDENPQIICRTTADSIGRWECKSTISIPNGKHNLMFEITDPAENTTTLLSSITINENLAETGKGVRIYLLLGFTISYISLSSIIKKINKKLKNN